MNTVKQEFVTENSKNNKARYKYSILALFFAFLVQNQQASRASERIQLVDTAPRLTKFGVEGGFVSNDYPENHANSLSKIRAYCNIYGKKASVTELDTLNHKFEFRCVRRPSNLELWGRILSK